MSTRARASRQASAYAVATTSTTSATIRKRDETDETAMDVDGDGIENVNTKVKVVNGRAVAKKSKGKKVESVDCVCSTGDDGSPMILCSMCKIWYHFTCVDITEPQAEEISVYICPTCTQTTGRRSARYWEGEQAVEECTDDDDTTVVQRRKAVMKTRPTQQRNGPADAKQGPDAKLVEALKFEPEESDDDSEDDYVEENGGGHKKRQSRLRRMSIVTATSDDDAESADDKVAKGRRVRRLGSRSRSPGTHASKRKAKSASVGQGASPAPPPKRKRSDTGASSSADHNALDDPVRKYCLSKLEDMFKEVYFRYPYVRLKEEEDVGGGTKTIKKEMADMEDQEKEVLAEDSRRFAHELETCVYEIYAEPDKNGNPHAGAKYKDRFRTLQFNLSKPDRVVIHHRILSGSLSAKEISTMSSTDLADEETKQSIKQAEKESLEHSILQKQIVPRAKITHKGLQDIEDVRGEIASVPDFELEKEQQEEEKREREKLARLKTTQANRQRTASISVPPESPIVPQSAASMDGHQEQWGAPPPLPFHAMVNSPVEETAPGQRPSLYVQTSSDFMNAIPEPELNLDDIIHIDEDQDVSHTKMTIGDGSSLATNPTAVVASPTEMTSDIPLSISTTGISPFAQRQDTPRAPSFDLNALWSEQPPSAPVVTDGQPKVSSAEANAQSGPASLESRDDGDNMELESVEANDQDFDMFLADDAEAEPQPPLPEPSAPLSVENLPQVWTGKITMPFDSSTTKETTLVARQIGGKPLPADSPLWKTLFPSNALRIEGRVPIENSMKYLVQMRLNPSKELYAVAFVPAGPQDENDLEAFNSFLISKSRHGLVFPWGNRPKEYHPGRELYIIPLLHTHTLPEFVELLDDLKVPKIRSKDYLIGVWILNKGKLAPLPGLSLHAPPPVVQPPAVFFNQQPGSGPTVPQLPNLGLGSEVAGSLTPDQIQNILRTLASTTQAPLALQATQVTQPPFSLHGQPPSMPPQPWTSQAGQPPPLPFPFNFPPPNVSFQQPPVHNSPNSPPRYDHQGLDRNDYGAGGYDRDYRSGPSHDHGDRNHRGGGERGWRGQNRGRGRGRGRGEGHQDRDFRSQRDSGWPRRPKTDGQEGSSW